MEVEKKIMTVADLIVRLSELDPTMEIVIPKAPYGYPWLLEEGFVNAINIDAPDTEFEELEGTYCKHTADWIDPMNAKELEEHCFDLTDTWYGYKTQELAMNSILEDIKYFIAQDNAKKNVKIRNIKTMETFTVTELKQQFAEGKFNKFNHIKDKKGK